MSTVESIWKNNIPRGIDIKSVRDAREFLLRFVDSESERHDLINFLNNSGFGNSPSLISALANAYRILAAGAVDEKN